MNGWELMELHDTADVSYTTPIDADSLLIKDSTASLWKRLTWANLKSFLFNPKQATDTVVVGLNAGANITTGFNNTFVGEYSGNGITTGHSNTIIGRITGLTPNLINNTIIGTGLGSIIFRYNPQASSGGLIQFYPTVTANQTASTEIPVVKINSTSTSLATGSLTMQRFFYIPTQTLGFSTASTATDVFGAYFESATIGTNATVTNNYSLGTNGKAKFGGNIELTQTVTTETVTSDTTVTIKINGVNYKLLAKS